jgi:hypothetical protein
VTNSDNAASKKQLIEKGMQPAKVQAATVKITPSNPTQAPDKSK